jgi:hypothetical protein
MPVSSIEMERRLKERSRGAAATKTHVTKVAKGQRRVPASAEVRQAVADGETAAGREKTKATVGAAAKKMTGGKKPAATKASTKAKKPAAKRLTDVWLSAKKKDVQIKDEVTLPNGAVIKIVGRWSKHLKDDGLIPMVTGRIVSGAPAGKSKGDRLNAIAAEVTHVAKK